ncbi:MAG: LptF/LptG family permease [Deltaproteobacteria bacterium]|nr:LptF/LptG family permease [Deltaproteobacteria bacterium]
MIRPNLVHRYLIREIVPLFLLGVCIFVFLLMMSQILRINELLVVHGVPLKDVLVIFGYLLCMFLSMSVPMSLFFAVVGTFGRLSADNEITALRASGIGLSGLLVPVAIIALFLSFSTFWLTSYVEPWGHRSFRYLLKKVATLAVTSEMKQGSFQQEFYGFTFYAESVDYKNKVLQHVVVHDKRGEKYPLALFAKNGFILKNPHPSASEFDITLRLFDGRIIHDSRSPSRHQSLKFAQCDINLNVTEFFRIPHTIPETLTSTELRKCSKEDADSKMRIGCETEFHRRVAMSGGSLIFAFAGMVLGLSRRKSAKSRSFVLAAGFSLIYWLLVLSSSYLAQQQWLPVAAAMWWPNLAILVSSVWLYRRHMKRF